jgi:hypothetical protein
MILFDLRCARGHPFEGWFRDGGAFDQQAAQGEIGCPVCGDTSVTKALMAPAVRAGARREAEKTAQVMGFLRHLRREVERTCEHVGPRFVEEASKIHHGETEERGIYGEATPEQARELRDEGIEVRRLPWIEHQDS